MSISWDIQRKKNKTRSKSLQTAWAIFSNQDITLKYLWVSLKYKPAKKKVENQNDLFQSHIQ